MFQSKKQKALEKIMEILDNECAVKKQSYEHSFEEKSYLYDKVYRRGDASSHVELRLSELQNREDTGAWLEAERLRRLIKEVVE